MTGHVDPTRDVLAALRDLPSDRPVAMINLLRFRPLALYPAGHPDGLVETTGAGAYETYGRAAAAPFARAGGERLWLGRPEMTVIGPRDEVWDLAFIARYPTGEAFLAMLRDPDYQAAVVHRQAAVADSRLIRCAAD